MTQYMDMTNVDGCFGVIPKNGETIVFTGVTVNSMPLSVKRKEGDAYADFAKQCGIRFIFDDDIPPIDFYTVPRIDVAARDEDGGLIASVGEPFSLRDPVPLVYITKDRKCYLITSHSSTFLSIASEWKEQLTPYTSLTIYVSKVEAAKDYQIIDLEKTKDYQNLMQMMNSYKSERQP